MVPPEFEMPRRSQRGLVDGFGKLLRYVAGVATVEEVKKMHGRLSLLENYISDNQQGTRSELGRLLVVEKLVSQDGFDAGRRQGARGRSVGNFACIVTQNGGYNT